jgi:hypothetical protein
MGNVVRLIECCRCSPDDERIIAISGDARAW